MESGTDEEAADRALSGVFRKLDKSLSVEYTVNDLISEATDIANLATIFPGAFCSYERKMRMRADVFVFRLGPMAMNWLTLTIPSTTNRIKTFHCSN